jgi:hypothetical protein
VMLVAREGVDSLAALSHRRHWRAQHRQRGCHVVSRPLMPSESSPQPERFQ